MPGGTKAWGREQEHGKWTERFPACTALGFSDIQSWQNYLHVHCLLLSSIAAFLTSVKSWCCICEVKQNYLYPVFIATNYP